MFKSDTDWRKLATAEEEFQLRYLDEVIADCKKERQRIRKRCNARNRPAT